MRLKYTITFELDTDKDLYPEGVTTQEIINFEESAIQNDGLRGLTDLLEDDIPFSTHVSLLF